MNRLFLSGVYCRDEGDRYWDRFIKWVSPSGRVHYLPIDTVYDYNDGEWLTLEGHLCTANLRKDGKRVRKLHFANGALKFAEISEYRNEFTVSFGYLVKLDKLRITAESRIEAVDFVVADGSNYYNCVAFEETAKSLTMEKKVGDKIDILEAKFRSREYVKDGEKRIAYEVGVKDFK